MKTYKKIIAMLLTIVLFTSLTGNVFAAAESSTKIGSAQVVDDKIIQSIDNVVYKTASGRLAIKPDPNSNEFRYVNKVVIDPYNVSQMESIITSNGILPETAEGIREYSKKCLSDPTFEGGPINVYLEVPAQLNSRSTKAVTRGYGNKEYYNQYAQYENGGEGVTLVASGSNWHSYLTNGIEIGVEYLANSILDKVTLGFWSLTTSFLNGLIPPSVPYTSGFEILSDVLYDKWVKTTYVVENGGYYFGAHVESAHFKFTSL